MKFDYKATKSESYILNSFIAMQSVQGEPSNESTFSGRTFVSKFVSDDIHGRAPFWLVTADGWRAKFGYHGYYIFGDEAQFKRDILLIKMCI